MRQYAPDNKPVSMYETLVFWDKSFGEKGYQVVEGAWELNPDKTFSDRYTFWLADYDLDQTDQLDIFSRIKNDFWLWTKEPVSLFPGFKAMYFQEFFKERLVVAAARQGYLLEKRFSGLDVYDELHGRPVKIACATETMLRER